MAVNFVEELHKGYAQSFNFRGPMLVDERSEYQHIMVLNAPALGRVLVLDHIVQLTTRDECTYSEMLVHVPYFELLARGVKAKRGLVIGGGDGAVAEEFLKHESFASVDMAEIDGRVIEVSRQYLAEAHKGALDNPRLKIRVADGAAFIREKDSLGAFDIIVADRPDPVGPAEVLFADEFYHSVSRALNETGIAIFQTGVPFFQPTELGETLPQLARAFKHVGVILTVTPTYIGGYMALTWGSNGTRIGAATLEEITRLFNAARIQTDHYTPEVHRASLALPGWVKRLVPDHAS